MADTSKVRLAVGLFGTARELAAAMADLGTQGMAPARMNVLAQADAFDGTLAGWWANREVCTFGDWIVCRSGSGAVPWTIAPAGHDARPTRRAVDDARELLALHHWALQRHARRLHRCLEQGGALLLVELATEAEERAACTVLLRHASGGVQTHEIARAHARS